MDSRQCYQLQGISTNAGLYREKKANNISQPNKEQGIDLLKEETRKVVEIPRIIFKQVFS